MSFHPGSIEIQGRAATVQAALVASLDPKTDHHYLVMGGVVLVECLAQKEFAATGCPAQEEILAR